VGNSLLLVGCGLFSFTPDSFNVPRILYASQVISGFGAGMTFTVTTFLMSLNADFEDHAIGQGLIAQGRVIGGTLGVAMGSALFSNHIAGLAGVLTPAEHATLARNPGFTATLKLPQQTAVRQAFAASFNESLRICTYITAASLFVSFFVWQTNPPSIQMPKKELEAAIRADRARNEVSSNTKDCNP
jgi:hypothetical protein